MNCPDPEIISAFADGELETNQAAEVERHVAQCASCQRLLGEMQWLNQRGRAAMEAIEVGEVSRNVVYLKPLWLRSVRPMSLAAAAAFVAIVTVTAAWLFFNQSSLARRLTTSAVHSLAESEDAAFAQWLEPYRELNIPLVPMEVAANYYPTPVLPIRPDNIERN